MKRTQLALPLLLAALATGTLLGGCVVRPAVAVPAPVVYVGTANIAPPPPQVEVIGAPPQPGYVWLGGYWNWVGGRHVWVAGHWEPRHPGYRWVPHAWVRVGGVWQLREGYWARR